MSDEMNLTIVLDAEIDVDELRKIAQQLANAFAKIRQESGRDIRLATLPEEDLEEDSRLFDFYRYFEEAVPVQDNQHPSSTTYTMYLQMQPKSVDRRVLVGSPHVNSGLLAILLSGSMGEPDFTSQRDWPQPVVFEMKEVARERPVIHRDVRRNWRQQAASHTRLIHKRYRGVK